MMVRIKNLILLARCFIYFFWHGRATKDIQKSKKFLVIQTAKLGDMVCTTPVFSAIKNNYPEADVYVMGNKINQELLEGNKDVDGYIEKCSNFNYLLETIKKLNFDYACLITPSFENLALAFLAGIPRVVAPKVINGYSPYETKSYKILRKLVIAMPHTFGNYAPREYLRLLEPVGIHSAETTKNLAYSETGIIKIKNLLMKNGVDYTKDFVVGLAPSVANKIKLWPAERFALLADYVITKYQAKVILIGGPNDLKQSEQVGSLAKNKLMNLTGQLNIEELKALISLLKLFISVDTGPIYIAEAFEITTIDILGPMAAGEQPPVGQLHKIVELKDRKPQLHIMNARKYDATEARRQIEEISVQMVVEKVDEISKEIL